MACSGINRMDLESTIKQWRDSMSNYRLVIISSSVTVLSDKQTDLIDLRDLQCYHVLISFIEAVHTLRSTWKLQTAVLKLKWLDSQAPAILFDSQYKVCIYRMAIQLIRTDPMRKFEI